MRMCLFVIIFVLTFCEVSAFQPDSSKVRHPAALQILRDTNKTAKTSVEDLLEQIAPIQDLSIKQLKSLISEMNGFSGCPCPNCKEFTLEFNLKEKDKITCTNCGMIYPNELFPADRVLKANNPQGKKITYQFYTTGGYQYFIPGKIRRERHLALSRAALSAARLYYRTKEEKYAHLSLVIIDRFAEVYPEWCVHYDHIKKDKGVAEKRPWPYFGGKWNHWYHLDMPIDLIFAYDLIYDSQALYEYDVSTDYSVRKKLEEFFRSTYNFIMECKEDHGMGVGNMTPYTTRHFIACGRVINDSDMIHTAAQWMRRLCASKFYFDGMWSEGSLGYHAQTARNLLRAEKALSGYLDPEAYVDNKYGITFDGKTTDSTFTCAEKVSAVPERLLYPDGSWSRIHDTDWIRKGVPPDYLNIELNAFGHFAIGRGKGDDVIQAHLHFCSLLQYSHMHDDHLNIIIFGAGRELVSDIGYVRGKNRYFTTGKIGHNLVAVDWTRPSKTLRNIKDTISRPIEADNNSRSSLLAYDPGATSDKWVQMIEAEAPNTFGTNLPMYRRALMLIGANNKRSYLLDVFRVEGGVQHDWLLHGSSDEDMVASTNAVLKPIEGTLASVKSKYGQVVWGAPQYSWLIDNLRQTALDDGLMFSWRGQESGASLNAWVLPIIGGKAIFGRSPSFRRAGRTWLNVEKYKMPYIDLRHIGKAQNQNTYIAIYDTSLKGQSPIVDEVKNLPITPPAAWARAISIRCGDRTDIIYMSLDDSPRRVAGNTFSGRFAITSSLSGKTDYVYGWGFSKIEFDQGQLTTTAIPPYRVIGTMRKIDGEEHNGIIIEGSLPEINLDQSWLRVIHGDGTSHGYMIVGMHELGANKALVITRGDPGFRVTAEGIQMTHFPHWKIKGMNSLEIFNSAFLKVVDNKVTELKTTLPQSINVNLNKPNQDVNYGH
jgi:hypothetical protein